MRARTRHHRLTTQCEGGGGCVGVGSGVGVGVGGRVGWHSRGRLHEATGFTRVLCFVYIGAASIS